MDRNSDCRFFLSCLRFSFHNSINTDLLNTEQQWSFHTTERKVIYPDISTVYHLSIIINLCDPPLSSQTCSWIRTLSCLTCTWRHAPSVVLTAGWLQSDACSCVSVPQDCLAGTSCLCVHPDGEASPWGGGGGEGGGVWVHRSRFAIRSAAFHCHSLPRILAAYRLHQRGQMTQIHRE